MKKSRLLALLIGAAALLVLAAAAAAEGGPPNITNGPNDPTTSTSAQFTFTDEAGSQSECKLDTGPFVNCESSTGHSYSGLELGDHTFQVRWNDGIDNPGLEATHSWRIEEPPPPPDPPVNTGEPTISGNAQDGETLTANRGSWTGKTPMSFDYQWMRCDSGGGSCQNVGGNSTNYSLGGDDVGKKLKVEVTATNDDGDAKATSNLTGVVDPPPDTTAPTVFIDTPKPANVTTNHNATLHFSADEIVNFFCKLDGADPALCGTGDSGSKTYSGLGDGSHTFSVYAVDTSPAGNGGPATTKSHSWRIHTAPVNVTPPTINSPNGLKEGETVSATQGTWGGTVPITYAYKWFRCNPGGSGCTQVGTGQSYTLDSDDVDFAMKVTVTASNEADDVSASSALTPKVVDETAPDINLAAKPAVLTNRLSATFVFSSTERRPSFRCKLDAGAFVPCTSPRTYPRLRPGRHIFQIQATDRSQQVVVSTHTWTIDRTRPPAPTGFSVRGGDRLVVLTWGAPSARDFALVRVRRFASPGVLVYRGARTIFRDRSVRNGKLYRYRIRAVDRAGNISRRVTRVIRPRDPLFRPRQGALLSVNRPPLIRWKADPSARTYNVQVRKLVGGQWRKIQSVFPRRARYQLPRQWRYKEENRRARVHRFTAGVYLVHVWPWYGTRFGRLIGYNSFRAR